MPKLKRRSENTKQPTTTTTHTTQIPPIPLSLLKPITTDTTTSREAVTPTTKRPRILSTNTFADDDSDDDDVLNENISAKRKVKSMEKAQRILSKYKTDINCKTNPETKISWLVHTTYH